MLKFVHDVNSGIPTRPSLTLFESHLNLLERERQRHSLVWKNPTEFSSVGSIHSRFLIKLLFRFFWVTKFSEYKISFLRARIEKYEINALI